MVHCCSETLVERMARLIHPHRVLPLCCVQFIVKTCHKLNVLVCLSQLLVQLLDLFLELVDEFVPWIVIDHWLVSDV